MLIPETLPHITMDSGTLLTFRKLELNKENSFCFPATDRLGRTSKNVSGRLMTFGDKTQSYSYVKN